MPEKVAPGPVSDDRCIREAVCIHTKKIFDSCKDKDCIEDLRVYPTCGSQEVLDRALSVKAGTAELLYAYIDVEPVGFNRGFYTVDVRYFYRITADAFIGAARPIEVCGLAVFDKRAILFGSEGGAKSFSSDSPSVCSCQDLMGSSLPTAHVEAIAYKRPCPGHRRQKPVDRSRSLLYTPRYTPDIPCIPFPSPGPRENRSVFITR
ncbi:MAG: hypothetical protein V8S86_03945 [Eubacteriales bacterium]